MSKDEDTFPINEKEVINLSQFEFVNKINIKFLLKHVNYKNKYLIILIFILLTKYPNFLTII